MFVLSMMYFDWRMAGDVKQFEVRREHDSKLSLGAENPIRLSLRNRSRRTVQFMIRDEAPELFKIETRTMEGSVAARGTWEFVYHVRPLRRGDYQFGNLTLRWLSPLGLVMRQSSVEAKEPVKVYPNLLDVRRYDLLLRAAPVVLMTASILLVLVVRRFAGNYLVDALTGNPDAKGAVNAVWAIETALLRNVGVNAVIAATESSGGSSLAAVKRSAEEFYA